MSPTRTVVIGSAIPLILLLGLVVLPAAQLSPGLREPEPPQQPSSSSTILLRTANLGPRAVAAADQQANQEAKALDRLQRAIRAARAVGFSGTEVVSAWYSGGVTRRVLKLSQRPAGVRTSALSPAGTSSADPLAAPSGRALVALAAAYQLRLVGGASVAGRATTVIAADRDGREMARIWVDDATGLLLRQDVRDQTGQLRRQAVFTSLSTDAARSTTTSTAAVQGAAPAPATGWTEVALSDLPRWRADGWPCRQQLAAGYVLLDARRGTSSTGTPVLHLTYGDGLTAISVFLQRGELDDTQLTGLHKTSFGKTAVQVRDGSPEVMVWQGGRTVITAVGEADPAQLWAILGTLPRQPERGRLGSLQHDMGSAFAWLKS